MTCAGTSAPCNMNGRCVDMFTLAKVSLFPQSLAPQFVSTLLITQL